jgi:hypothetical protein
MLNVEPSIPPAGGGADIRYLTSDVSAKRFYIFFTALVGSKVGSRCGTFYQNGEK